MRIKIQIAYNTLRLKISMKSFFDIDIFYFYFSEISVDEIKTSGDSLLFSYPVV